jgi:autotransporter-associated beta strand protein
VSFDHVEGRCVLIGRSYDGFMKSKHLLLRPWYCVAVVTTLLNFASPSGAQSTGNRVLGIDVSYWQGNISQTTWNNIQSVENRQFVFIRASRGGTTGVDQQAGGYPAGSTSQTFSRRYDDPYFIQNINRATAAGMYAGSYHFSRPDIIASTPNSGGIANSGTDEANHFMEMAGAFMRPGYLAPVLDLEAGAAERTSDEMAQFALDFSNRIYTQMGIRPAIYINGNYANELAGASVTLRNQLAQPSSNPPNLAGPAFTQLWSARYANQADPNSIPVQTGHPKDTFTNIYGPWDDHGTTHPWTFWQYASTGRLNSFNNGNSDLDFNVAQGGIEFLKDQLVPAVWMNDSSGDWSTLLNWNSGQPVTAPPSAPGQLTPIGTQTLPTPRLPGAAGTGPTAGINDTVILDRPNANITVTLSSGTHNIRKLYVRETLNITGGSLTVNYVPVAESTPMSAQFSAPVSISGGASLISHTVHVDPGVTFTAGGNALLTFDTLTLKRGTTPASLIVNGIMRITPRPASTANIGTNAGGGNSGQVDLVGGTQTISVFNGFAATDLVISVPLINGGLIKADAGTMALTGTSTYTGPTTVSQGKMWIGGSLGATTATVNGGASLGGTGSIGGSVTLAGGTNTATRGAMDLRDGSAGTLRLTDPNAANTVLTLGGTAGNASFMMYEVGSLGADRIQLDAGKLQVNPGGAIISITPLAGFDVGTYDLITFNTGQATGLQNVSLSSTTMNGYTLSLQTTPTALQLMVVPVPEPVGLGLFSLGVIGFWKFRRRRRKPSNPPFVT